jgi:molybdate transport system ATP-binding protein
MIAGDNPKAYGQNLFLFGKRKGSGETVWEIKEKIGYLTPAMTDLFNTRHTLEEMIVSGFFDSIGLYIKPSEIQLRLADEWLLLIEMLHLKNKPFCTLTLGQQRMALIARAMVKHPPLLILDEPTSGLDDHNVAVVTSLINKIAAESSTAILYVSHRAEEGLKPQFIFRLAASENGSTGAIINNN